MFSIRSSSSLVCLLAAGLLPPWIAACGTSSQGDGGGANGNVGMLSPPPAGNGMQAPSAPAPEPAPPAPPPEPMIMGGETSPATTEGGVMPGGLDNAGAMPSGGGANEAPAMPGAGDNASLPCPASATLQAGDTTKTITVDGLQRTFLVHAPPGYDSTSPVPVVLDFHGLGGNSNQQKNLSRWDDLADTEGFITIYPQGVENAWDAGLCCGDSGADDVAFVRAILQTMANDACIDARRVFASGCSNGGGMSYRLACEAADVITAVAPVDFDCVDGPGCSNCEPSRPITVVQFRGTNDQLVPYEGNAGAFAGAQNNLATWGEINACTGAPAAVPEATGCESFPSCGAGAQTQLCTVQNGTHCGSYTSFRIAEVAWRVLEGQTRP